MLSIGKNNDQHANTFSRLQREENVFKLEIDGTHMQLSIPMTLNPLPPTRISSHLNKVGHANIKWKGSKCFLANKHACAKSFFSVSIPYITPHESFILKAEEDWGE